MPHMPDFQYGEVSAPRTPSKEQGITVRKSPYGAESGQLGGCRARSARFSVRELLPRRRSVSPRRLQLADRSGPDRLHRSARARRLPRRAVRYPDHERRAPAREPGLDREHRGLRREEAPVRPGSLTMDKVTADALAIDPERVATEIEESLRAIVSRDLHRRGGVVGVSGGIDSSVTVGLCARALGPERTLALLMPEAESDPETLDISTQVADAFGVQTVVEDITEILQATGCYERREEAVRSVIPQYGIGWKFKIVLPSVVGNEGYRLFSLVAQAPNGETIEVRLPAEEYRTIVAATNFKQRTRKMLEYFHADRLNYAVAGTPNLLEYDQGFFVKGGDGAADVKPIAHLYKTQVYALAEALGVPAEIRMRPPTTDTYSLPQTQEEFYFSLPYDQMDLVLNALNQGLSAEEAAAQLDLQPEQVQRVYDDIDQKRRTTRYLHLAPQLVEAVFDD